VVENVCSHDPLDIGLRRPIYLAGPATTLIVCDHVEKYVFWIVFGRG